MLHPQKRNKKAMGCKLPHQKHQEIVLHSRVSSGWEEVMLGNVFDNVILPLLTTKEVYALRCVSKKCLQKFNRAYMYCFMKKCIIDRLKKMYGTDYHDFVQVMANYNAVISGSFLIQCLLNEEWGSSSDLDIYFSQAGGYSGQYRYERFKGFFQHISTEYDEIWNDEKGEPLYHRLCGVIGITNFIYPNPTSINKIQTVEIGDDSRSPVNLFGNNTANSQNKNYIGILKKHINKTGFEVCRNSANFYYKKGKIELNLSIFDLKQVLSKRTKFVILDGEDFLYRAHKYQLRGFSLDHSYPKIFAFEYCLLKDYLYHFKTLKYLESRRDMKCIENDSRTSTCFKDTCIVHVIFGIKHVHFCMDATSYSDYSQYFMCSDVRDNRLFRNLLPGLCGTERRIGEIYNEMHRVHNINEYAKIRGKYLSPDTNEYGTQPKPLPKSMKTLQHVGPSYVKPFEQPKPLDPKLSWADLMRQK